MQNLEQKLGNHICGNPLEFDYGQLSIVPSDRLKVGAAYILMAALEAPSYEQKIVKFAAIVNSRQQKMGSALYGVRLSLLHEDSARQPMPMGAIMRDGYLLTDPAYRQTIEELPIEQAYLRGFDKEFDMRFFTAIRAHGHRN